MQPKDADAVATSEKWSTTYDRLQIGTQRSASLSRAKHLRQIRIEARAWYTRYQPRRGPPRPTCPPSFRKRLHRDAALSCKALCRSVKPGQAPRSGHIIRCGWKAQVSVRSRICSWLYVTTGWHSHRDPSHVTTASSVLPAAESGQG